VKIAAVHTAVVEGNYDWTFVRIDSDVDGLRGLGECYTAPGLTAIVRDLAPLLVGEDPRDVDRLWAKLRWGASGAGSPAGIVYNAISGLEAALWDLVGRAYGVPIHRLLGGRFRDTVRIYADCHAGEALESMDATMVPRPARWAQDPPEALASGAVRAPAHGRAYAAAPPDELFTPEMYARRAREVVAEHGFSALKFDLDVPTPFQQDTASGTLTRAEVRAMVELAAAVIDAVGDEVDVAFDCHWRYQVADASRLAHELEPLGLMWLEDPVPPENVAALRRVTRSTATPIATGENGYLRHGFREAFETGAIDVAAPDLQKTGGLLEGRRIADYADTHYIAVAPHCIASPIGTIASVHVAAAVPNFLALEWHGMSVPFWESLASGWEGPVIDRGRIRVPDGPGLGVELNLDVAREYARPGEPFFDEDGS
jgi:L-alanine-DL-glutamate epimerase-like enolase superfamily enzyme